MWLPLLGTARLRKKSNTGGVKVKRRPARLAKGEETDQIRWASVFMGKDKQSEWSVRRVRVTVDRWCRTVTQRHE